MGDAMRTLTFSSCALIVLGCSAKGPSSDGPLSSGQTEFVSTTPGGNSRSGGLAEDGAGGPTASPGAAGSASSAGSSNSGTDSGTPRAVEETDLYRVDGDRLYYLNGYRGLMVFDVSNVDQPKLLVRSPIYGDPIEMVVRNGIATIVVSDWYGKMDDGTPFHGSIVRGIDARDTANVKVLGEALLGGYVRDTRVVGDVLYAVTQKYPWDRGWYGGVVSDGPISTSNSSQVTVNSVNFAGGNVQAADSYEVPGVDGIFNVTPNSILLASAVTGTPDQYGYAQPTGETELTYVDITDPAGAIEVRGSVRFAGYLQGWGADNGRWNLDFADGVTAHALGCEASYCSNGQALVLATADFSNPDAPSLSSRVTLPGNTWSPTARFDQKRMYLAPSDGYTYSNSGVVNQATPIQIYDLADPAQPALLGSASISGQVFNFFPAGDRLFALGSQYTSSNDRYGNQVSLSYLDVSDPAAPVSLGTAAFGEGWAWTPAAGTFKAFTKSDAEGLVVLPFSGYSYEDRGYNNGLQLIEFTPSTIESSGAAKTKGWVERGIFVKNRLVSLSDLALSVVDFADRATPRVVTELTLARNVLDSKPGADGTLMELSSDWWDNYTGTSKLRTLPAADVEELSGDATLAELDLPGINPKVYHDGDLSYVVTQLSRLDACPSSNPGAECEYWYSRVQVVDRAGGTPRLRGALDLPQSLGHSWWGWGWGFWGCGMSDWYYGAQTLQVNGHLLASQTYRWENDQTKQVLSVIDLSNPDQPAFGETEILDSTAGWWGNLRTAGDQLYATHYEWVTQGSYANGTYVAPVVKYYLDRIDLSQPQSPRVAMRINVPGVLVGASEADPNVVYTMDYRWDGDRGRNELAVLKLDGELAYLQGSVEIPGYVGNVFVRGSRAYFTAEVYEPSVTGGGSGTYSQRMYEADLSNLRRPTLHESTPTTGWGWLVAVEGDRAFVTSGWGQSGLDVFKLTPGAKPEFDQFVRVRGYYPNGVSRQGNDVYFATGYWGTEHVSLTP